MEAIITNRMVAAFEISRAEPRPRGSIKLAGEKDLYRIRVGRYRIIYQIDDKFRRVLVVKIQHRREVYR